MLEPSTFESPANMWQPCKRSTNLRPSRNSEGCPSAVLCSPDSVSSSNVRWRKEWISVRTSNTDTHVFEVGETLISIFSCSLNIIREAKGGYTAGVDLARSNNAWRGVIGVVESKKLHGIGFPAAARSCVGELHSGGNGMVPRSGAGGGVNRDLDSILVSGEFVEDAIAAGRRRPWMQCQPGERYFIHPVERPNDLLKRRGRVQCLRSIFIRRVLWAI